MKGLHSVSPWICVAALILITGALVPHSARAQDEAGTPPDTSGLVKADTYANMTAGEFTPAQGFDIIRTRRGSLNISAYGLFRYLGQFPANQTFTDHLGRTRLVTTKNDINWHRTFVWVTGFLGDPKFLYNISIWSLASTEQTLLFGNLQYRWSKPLVFGVGLGPNNTNRSLQGSWPFWAGSDRQMTEEALRGGFSSAAWVSGQPINRMWYKVSINRSLSQLGITAAQDNRDFAYSGSVVWMPTTGEFGPRGGLGDLEYHEDLATRFGASACTAREGRYAPNDQAPRHSQIRMSDGVNPFETGALADTVTVEKLTYQNLSLDAGFKYRGFSFQGEYTMRKLSDFSATSPVPVSSLFDHGFFMQAMHMVVPKRLGVYAATSYIMDDFKRYPWEVAAGASYYPFGSRSWRLNLHLIHVEKSPAGSSFGYYVPGQTGNIISIGTDILL
ncbi:MAG TPA: hypothetical protein VFQ05_03485 [Candidatus Eisenbacteria bacterium]|nr:hypothetical protein [Candidatus Eisenbacteria bacterium]